MVVKIDIITTVNSPKLPDDLATVVDLGIINMKTLGNLFDLPLLIKIELTEIVIPDDLAGIVDLGVRPRGFPENLKMFDLPLV